MKKRLTTAFVALMMLAGGRVQAQFEGLKSVGDIPADLKMSIEELYEADLQRAEKYAGGRVRDRQQVIEGSYRINKMMAGGRIVYGDPITRMIERIADTLLVDYPELRQELRFYTVKSPDVNAFATSQGMVFVNAGLVAQVENEAQLAFIIGHEIVHYYRSHSLEELVGKNKKKKRTANVEDESTEMNDFLRRHHRSREMENEADSLGIALFYLKSPYDKEVTEGVFDVLQYSELPFDDVPFDTNYFNTPYYKLTGCWLDSVADITSRDNYDDSRSTHPNILSRRIKCANTLDGYYGGEKYVITTADEFNRLRHLARLESIRQELIHGQYSRAFYNTWLLQRINPDDEYLNQCLAQALYGVAMFKNHMSTNAVTGDYNKVEGESQQVYYALRQMSNDQATMVALHKVWECKRRFPDNEAFDLMATDLLEELRTSLKKSNIDFTNEPQREEQADTAATQTEEKAMTKYERIKQKRKVQTQKSPSAYAFTDLMMNDAEFAEQLRMHLNGTAPVTKKDTDSTASNGIIVFDPSYYVLNDHDDNMKIKESARCESDLLSRIVKMSNHFDRPTVDFSDEGLHEMEDADQYNDFVTLCEWMNEFWQTKGQFNIQRLTQPDMDSLLDRYGASTVNMTAVLNIEGLTGEAQFASIIVLPLAPLVLVGMFTGIEQTALVSIMVDARNGKILTRQTYNYKRADHNAFVDAMIYDTYARALRPGKKEPTGHMGHHVAIAGGFNMGMSGLQPLKHGHILAFSPWGSLEVAVSRKSSLAFSVRYQKGYEDVGQNTDPVPIFDEEFGYLTGYQPGDGTYKSKNMLTLGLDYRIYKESDFAPLGFYFDIGAHMVHFSQLKSGTSAGNTFGIHGGIGRNYILFQRLLINYGVDYAYTYGISKIIGIHDKKEADKMYGDAVLSNILTFKLGIGFIPF